jgi:hypothetical protein
MQPVLVPNAAASTKGLGFGDGFSGSPNNQMFDRNNQMVLVGQWQ